MFERSNEPSKNPERRRKVEDIVLALEKLNWRDWECLDAKQAREARFVLANSQAMADRRHGICLEQSHAKGKTAAENAKTAAVRGNGLAA